jgi:hypothetical protein
MSATPKVVLEAFLPKSLTIAEIKLRPVTANHWMALEDVGSPFVCENPSGRIAMLDVCVALYILQLDPERIVESLDKAAISRKARALAGRIPVAHLSAVAQKIVKHIRGAFATRPASEAEGDGDADRPFAGRARKAAGGSSARSARSAKVTAGRSATP